MIYKDYNIDTKSIVIKKQFVPNYFPIKLLHPYKNTTSNIIIQTPILYIPFGFSKFNDNCYIDISFRNATNNKDIESFKNMIISIEDFFSKVVKFNKYKFISSIKKSDFFPSRLKVKFSTENKILIFNEDNINITNSKPLENLIQSKMYAKFIIQLSSIWTNKKSNSYGIIWNICQIKLYNNLEYKPIEFSFIEDHDHVNSNNTNYKTYYEKYFTMLKRGVPIFAIKQKLIIDNLDPNIIDTPGKIINSKEHETNNNSNSNSNTNTNSNTNNPILVLGNMITNRNFKLKQIDQEAINKSKLVNKLKNDSILTVPSKQEIINAREKLNRI